MPERTDRLAMIGHLLTSNTFAALGLADPILRVLDGAGLTTPTPIQAQAIPILLDEYDLIGIAQTGTGKTLSFVAPIVQHLAEENEKLPPKAVGALILAPTRELAIQISEVVGMLAEPLKLKHTCIFGGVGHMPQIRALGKGVDILVATPGRLLDLMQQRNVTLEYVSHLVLDEADRMLDMGFVHDVMRIVKALPEQRQSILVSATMPETVAKLAQKILYDPRRVEVTPQVVTVDKIQQSVFHVSGGKKRALLLTLLDDTSMSRIVIFARTKRGANRLSEDLEHAGIPAAAIHGNKSQAARVKALEQFRNGEIRILVATDIAARGIDVPDVTHVINYELPDEPESYVHRIGRTARAGREGMAIAFCDPTERSKLTAIERLTRRTLTVRSLDEMVLKEVEPLRKQDRAPEYVDPRARNHKGGKGGNGKSGAGKGSSHGQNNGRGKGNEQAHAADRPSDTPANRKPAGRRPFRRRAA